MPNYHRSRVEGGIYFFTVVTYGRLPIFSDGRARDILNEVWLNTCSRFPFETIAVCLLPDHLHCIWKLPEGDADYSKRWRVIKEKFTKRYLREIGPGEGRNPSRLMRNEAAIWQRRFWEHTIDDEEDLDTHVDYIHYNPVKHGYVDRVENWQWSSFHRYVKAGLYDPDWNGGEEGRLQLLCWE